VAAEAVAAEAVVAVAVVAAEAAAVAVVAAEAAAVAVAWGDAYWPARRASFVRQSEKLLELMAAA
jgi:hypothetical protein